MSILREFKSINSTEKELKSFALVVGSGFIVVGFLLMRKHQGFGFAFIGVAVILLLLRFLNPRWLLPLQKVWMALAIILGWFMTRLILIVLFLLVITPIALIMRRGDNELLDLPLKPRSKSYWKKRETQPTAESYYKQY